MQAGVEFLKDKSSQTPKHLRVGINVAMVDHGALVDLLIKKGLFTEEEYAEVLVESMRKEVNKYREEIAAEMDVDVEKIKLV
jgi:hypothetical protein